MSAWPGFKRELQPDKACKDGSAVLLLSLKNHINKENDTAVNERKHGSTQSVATHLLPSMLRIHPSEESTNVDGLKIPNSYLHFKSYEYSMETPISN